MGYFKLTSSDFSDGGEIPRECGWKKSDDPLRKNVSPKLIIEGIPYGTRSLSLIMEDEDAMKVPDDMFQDGKNPYKDPFVHWVLYDIHAFIGLTFEDMEDISARHITIQKSETTSVAPLTKLDWDQASTTAEFKKNSKVLRQHMIEQYGSNFALAGVNGFGEFAYGGPAPPDKKHTYFFRLYATDFEGYTAGKPGTSEFTRTSSDSSAWDATSVRKKMEDHIIEDTQLTGTYAP
jgi:Raf kinase inhibitor-like YbhB/YbcL family protein